MNLDTLVSVALRAAVVYAFLFGVVRLLGKRKLGVHSALDFLAAILLADLAASAIFGSISLVHVLLAAGVVVGCHYAGYYLGYRVPKLRRWLTMEPTVMVRDGEILPQALQAERMTEAELLSLLRQQGVEEPATVHLAVLEPSGRLSVQRKRLADKADARSLRIVSRGGEA